MFGEEDCRWCVSLSVTGLCDPCARSAGRASHWHLVRFMNGHPEKLKLGVSILGCCKRASQLFCTQGQQTRGSGGGREGELTQLGKVSCGASQEQGL